MPAASLMRGAWSRDLREAGRTFGSRCEEAAISKASMSGKRRRARLERAAKSDGMDECDGGGELHKLRGLQ